MPTNYNIKFMAAHPLGMTFNPPENAAVLEAVEQAVSGLGMIPIAASGERGDDAALFTEREGKAWVHNAPDDLILAVAKMLDGFAAQASDEEGDITNFLDPETVVMPEGSVSNALAFLEYRKKATS